MTRSLCRLGDGKIVTGQGLCNLHYRRLRKYGDPEATPHHTKSVNEPGTLEHLLENTKWVNGPLDTQCRVWTKSCTQAGYGVVGIRPKIAYAHRTAYELEVNLIPQGYLLRHVCDNPPCTNTQHLILGLDQDNSDDKMERGRDRKFTKLTEEQVRVIRLSTESNTELASKFGVTPAWINSIRKGRTRTNVK